MNKPCPFEVGEIAVIESNLRRETFIARVTDIQIEFYGTGMGPDIIKATPEQKRMWYDCGERELIIKSW